MVIIERYKFINELGDIIEIEAPKEKAQKIVDKYYPNFKLVNNFL